jgi:hypothetical protein
MQRDRGDRHALTLAVSYRSRFEFLAVLTSTPPTNRCLLFDSVHVPTYFELTPESGTNPGDLEWRSTRTNKRSRLSRLTGKETAVGARLPKRKACMWTMPPYFERRL